MTFISKVGVGENVASSSDLQVKEREEGQLSNGTSVNPVERGDELLTTCAVAENVIAATGARLLKRRLSDLDRASCKVPLPLNKIRITDKQLPEGVSCEQFNKRFNHGKMKLEAVEGLLSDHPDSSALIRESLSQRCLTLSYVKNGQIFHCRLHNNNLDETLDRLDITYLLAKTAAENYDRQVVLNLGRGLMAAKLTAKAAVSRLPSHTVDLRTGSDLSSLMILTPRSRLYLIGHCGPGEDRLMSDEKKALSVEEYVQMLVDNAPALKTGAEGRRLKISVIACNSAVDKGEKKSFGYRLSQALYKAGIDADVVVRKGFVSSRWTGDPQHPCIKLVNGQHHGDGSKVTFTA